jgi:hypothetical protein
MDSEARLGCFILVIAIVLAIGWSIAAWSSQRTATCTVESVDRISDGNGGSDARIYTKECGVLENTDSIPFFKFNSADIQGQIKAGQVYTFDVAYWRIPLFSMFPDVLEVKAGIK